MIDPHVMIAYHKCHTSKSFCYEIKMQVIWLLHWQLNMHLWAPQRKKKKSIYGCKNWSVIKNYNSNKRQQAQHHNLYSKSN